MGREKNKMRRSGHQDIRISGERGIRSYSSNAEKAAEIFIFEKYVKELKTFPSHLIWVMSPDLN